MKPHTQHLLQSLQRLVTAAAGASKGPLPRALKAKAKAKVRMKPFNGINRPCHRVIVWVPCRLLQLSALQLALRCEVT